MSNPIIAIPVKPFNDAKGRLAGALPARVRGSLGASLAARTVRTAVAADLDPILVTADPEVERLGVELEIPVLRDSASGLNAAASQAVKHALELNAAWAICHADLPLLTVTDLEPVRSLLIEGRTVIAPSSDGGTSLLGSQEPIEFSYGPGSFGRHLAAIASRFPKVIVTLGLCLDLDTASDLEAARAHPRGEWLHGVLEA